MLLAAVSFLDDTRGLPVRWRLAAHFLAACALLPTVGARVGPLAALIAVAATVWMVNLYNFMDGSDGLAGGMAFFGFGFYALAAWLGGQPSFAVANLTVVAAAGAFLLFNFHPARIFMGDAGSIPLGFLAAALGFLGWQRGIWPLWFPPMVFSPFVVDASVTLLKRLLRREKVWQAHRDHYYQRLVRMGAGHRNTALMEYILMAAVGGASVWAAGRGGTLQAAFLLAWVPVYGGLLRWIDVHWQRFNQQGDYA
jgi:UDP-N-acetylmuramyl pentapeptide phosphotransferase/UDP-N-acetylglucosamine-1-phosphate transferase